MPADAQPPDSNCVIRYRPSYTIYTCVLRCRQAYNMIRRSLSVCRLVCLYACLLLCVLLSFCMPMSFCVFKCVCLSLCVYVCLSVFLSVCMYVCRRNRKLYTSGALESQSQGPSLFTSAACFSLCLSNRIRLCVCPFFRLGLSSEATFIFLHLSFAWICCWRGSLADPELQKRGEAKFLPKLCRFFRRFPKKFQHFPPKIVDYLPTFLMTIF